MRDRNLIKVISLLVVFTLPSVLYAKEPCKTVKVFKVIDGDTIKISCKSGDKYVVRLIGIDTPETHHPKKPVQCYGKEAADYLKKRIDNKYVRLKYESQKVDKYGRTLAYVYSGLNFINATMIRKGYAFAYKRFRFKYLQKFTRYESAAQKKKRGLWGKCEVVCEGNVCHTNPITK